MKCSIIVGVVVLLFAVVLDVCRALDSDKQMEQLRDEFNGKLNNLNTNRLLDKDDLQKEIQQLRLDLFTVQVILGQDPTKE